jgi:L-aminopeptidase/D-esterase-like protein
MRVFCVSHGQIQFLLLRVEWRHSWFTGDPLCQEHPFCRADTSHHIWGVLPKPDSRRDLGIPFEGKPGPLNAITDVKGVAVGQTTLISGEGKLVVGQGPVRTGVTAILPQGKEFRGRVFGAWFSLNGNGEMTGTAWLEESGCLGTPILITNTHSVGVVRDAVIEWNIKRGLGEGYTGDSSLPLVAETYDGFLNDINGFHVKKRMFSSLGTATQGL